MLGLLKKVQRVRRDLQVVIITTPPTAHLQVGFALLHSPVKNM